MSLVALLSLAFATELDIQAADGQTAVVLVDDFVKGETPVSTEVEPGEVTLAFRGSMFGPVLFSERVTIPAEGTVRFVVDLEARSVTAGPTTTPVAASPEPAPEPEPEPEPEPTRLRIAAEGASISLDGQDTGKTGPAELDVDPGRHVVKLTKGCAVAEQTVDAKVGQTTDLGAKPVAAKHLLGITSEPKGAEVIVDGESMGKTPVDLKLACGRRDVKLVAKGFQALSQVVDLQADETLALTMEAERYGSVEVSVEPSNTAIELDGEQVGKGSVTLDEVPVGTHELAFVHKGVVLERRAVEVKENGQIMLSLVVDPSKAPAAPVANDPIPAEAKTASGPGVGRILLNSAVTAAGIGVAIPGFYNYSQARTAYADYQELPAGEARDAFYTNEVRPRQTMAFVEWGVGGALVATGAVLWATTFTSDGPVKIAPTGNGFVLGGRF